MQSSLTYLSSRDFVLKSGRDSLEPRGPCMGFTTGPTLRDCRTRCITEHQRSNFSQHGDFHKLWTPKVRSMATGVSQGTPSPTTSDTRSDNKNRGTTMYPGQNCHPPTLHFYTLLGPYLLNLFLYVGRQSLRNTQDGEVRNRALETVERMRGRFRRKIVLARVREKRNFD